MKIIQKNVFGDNIVYTIAANIRRQLTPQLAAELLEVLKIRNVNKIAIRYEHSAETVLFVNQITNFLSLNKFEVYLVGAMMSEIYPGEFKLHWHPSNPSFARLIIGAI